MSANEHYLGSNKDSFFKLEKENLITVDMYCIGTHKIETGNESILTSGLGPCICIMLCGFVNDKPFILMHHWPGFVRDYDDFDECTLIGLSGRYLDEIKNLFNLEEDNEKGANIVLAKLSIIGGQKKEYCKDGTVNIRGTEREIAYLKSDDFINILENKFIIDDSFYRECHAFITKEDDTISVKINALGLIRYNRESYETPSFISSTSAHS